MRKKPIYFDYMATTPIDPQVIKAMLPYMGQEGCFGNPASITHVYGREAAIAVEEARQNIAEVIGADPEAIIFTSGATEANNLAILGAARFYQGKGRHVITMQTEHRAVLDSFAELRREGFEVTILPPQADGLLDMTLLEKALREDTILVSVMHVNNEIGVIQNIAAIGGLLKAKGILFHVDAAQSVGKLKIDLNFLSVDLMAFSAHKAYGPKGIGALYVRRKPRVRIQPLSFGGGHQNGLRAGTLPTHQIVGMGAAFRLAESLRVTEQSRLKELRQQLWKGIDSLPGLILNGHPTERVAGNLNFSVSGVESTALFEALNDLAVSTTSACSSASHHPSYVLRALGVSEALAYSSIRLSLGRYTTTEEIHEAIEIINSRVPLLRS